MAAVLLQVAKGANTTFVSTVTATFANPLTPGSVLLLAWEGDTGGSNSANTPTDTAGHTFTRDISTVRAATFDQEVWHASNSGSQVANAVTVTDTIGGVDSLLIVEEWSGIQAVTDLTGTGNGATASTFSTSSWSTTNANDLIWGAVAGAFGAGSPVMVAGAGYTNLSQNFTNFTTLATESKVVAATGSQTVTFTVSTGVSSYAVSGVAFKLTATVDASVYRPTRITSNRVGPQALRHSFHRPIYPQGANAPVTATSTYSGLLMFGIG